MRSFSLILVLLLTACYVLSGQGIGTFLQEVRTNYTTRNGLPANQIMSVAVTDDGTAFAATRQGLACFLNEKWVPVNDAADPVWSLATNGNRVAALSGKNESGFVTDANVLILNAKGVQKQVTLPAGIQYAIPGTDLAFSTGLAVAVSGKLIWYPNPDASPKIIDLPAGEIRQIALFENNAVLATGEALLSADLSNGKIAPLYPRDEKYSWAPFDVRGTTFDRDGRLWFASPQGAGVKGSEWKLFTSQEGLPYNDFTAAAAGEKGVVWFGTRKGAIRFDGKTWEYRQGKRWLADDVVLDLAVCPKGNAWFATREGVSVIRRVPMTLAEKAKWYEDEIDRYHRRTPYEYVLGVSVKNPGDKSEWHQHDSDNDGLWTSMYGAGECFAYAATKTSLAKERAKNAFEALHFLGEVTQGGTHPAPKGFVARTILPTSGPNPNDGRVEQDRLRQKNHDALWKVFEPRWPVNADGKWYWKTDTSSDELDGHYFFYGLYFDLVADTDAEKDRVRQHVQALTDHLIAHDFKLVDHDGKPTRWARYDPSELNYDRNWFMERGLNSLSMLSYLRTTAHITGDDKYHVIADSLISHHSYLQNLINQKFQRGIGTGNHSDDEMAFMCYYNLLKYETDPKRRETVGLSFWLNWKMEHPELNPFFNFAFAASCTDLTFTDAWGTYPVGPEGEWLAESIETLQRFPLDRFNWRHDNSQRIDLLRLHPTSRNFDDSPRGFENLGYRNNGKVIPVDECYFNHWSYNPWQLTTGGSGNGLGDGAVFLLPYYMGLYHGYIK